MQVLPLCFGVLGVLAITAEHATGLITTTLIAVPKRLLTLAGKTVSVGLVALTGLLFVLPAMTALLPGPWSDRLGSFLLPNLPDQIAGTTDGVLSPVATAAVLVAYAVLALAAGAAALIRRDS